jgi:16S rRNA G527 N7-methylase RsmG
MDKIKKFCELVLDTASHTVDSRFILKRHVEDALILSKFPAQKVLDIGCGCGWTSIVYAIENTESQVHYLERNEFQNDFIKTACSELDIKNCVQWTEKQEYDLVINKMLGNWKELLFIIRNSVIGPVNLVSLDNSDTPPWVEPCPYPILGTFGDINVVGAAL